MSPAEVVDRYLEAVSDPGSPPALLAELLHPEFVFREWPNAISPAGSQRGYTASLESLALSRKLLERSGFEVHAHLVQGDTVASRMTWRGRLAVDAGPLKAGMELIAHVSQYTTVRDGRIWRTESFDCYEPFPAAKPGRGPNAERPAVRASRSAASLPDRVSGRCDRACTGRGCRPWRARG